MAGAVNIESMGCMDSESPLHTSIDTRKCSSTIIALANQLSVVELLFIEKEVIASVIVSASVGFTCNIVTKCSSG